MLIFSYKGNELLSCVSWILVTHFFLYCKHALIGLIFNVEMSFCSRDEDDEPDEDEEEDGGEDPYEFSLSAVIDECARMASQDDPTNPGTSSGGGSHSKKRKIIKSSYFSDEEDED